MRFKKNDYVQTPFGKGIIDTPMEDNCLVMYSSKYDSDIEHLLGGFKIVDNEDMEKIEWREDAE